MECSDASMRAMKADIQAMPDGSSKVAADKEMRSAEAMLQKKDMKACAVHLMNAMEEAEK